MISFGHGWWDTRVRKPASGAVPSSRNQIVKAPVVFRFRTRHIMSARNQLRCDAAQKMRVAVIPVGQNGVAKDQRCA